MLSDFVRQLKETPRKNEVRAHFASQLAGKLAKDHSEEFVSFLHEHGVKAIAIETNAVFAKLEKEFIATRDFMTVVETMKHHNMLLYFVAYIEKATAERKIKPVLRKNGIDDKKVIAKPLK